MNLIRAGRPISGANLVNGDTLSEMVETTSRRTVGARDIPLVVFAPRRLFARVEDVTAWGWPLAILLTFVTTIGYATVQTGLIDREVDRGVQQRIAMIDLTQRDVVERSELSELYEREYKQGQFLKLLTRIQVIIAEPAKALATALLVAAVFYGMVALSGRKPEWHTLLTICVFAGFIDVLRLLTALALMLRNETLEVYTSLAPITQWLVDMKTVAIGTVIPIWCGLDALDPFRLWYWGVVLIGLATTEQLRGWRAWVVVGLCWLIGAGVRTGIAVATVSGMSGG